MSTRMLPSIDLDAAALRPLSDRTLDVLGALTGTYIWEAIADSRGGIASDSAVVARVFAPFREKAVVWITAAGDVYALHTRVPLPDATRSASLLVEGDLLVLAAPSVGLAPQRIAWGGLLRSRFFLARPSWSRRASLVLERTAAPLGMLRFAAEPRDEARLVATPEPPPGIAALVSQPVAAVLVLEACRW